MSTARKQKGLFWNIEKDMEVCGAKEQQSQKHLSSSMMEIHLFIKPRKYTVFLCDDPSVNFVALFVACIDITTLLFILN